jgi:BolA protein
MEKIMNDRVTTIKARLTAALKPTFLSIEDDSASHAHHAGAKASGGGHFTLQVVATAFEGKSLIQRHRLIYSALEGLIGPEIHAIQIVAKSPEEAESTHS